MATISCRKRVYNRQSNAYILWSKCASYVYDCSCETSLRSREAVRPRVISVDVRTRDSKVLLSEHTTIFEINPHVKTWAPWCVLSDFLETFPTITRLSIILENITIVLNSINEKYTLTRKTAVSPVSPMRKFVFHSCHYNMRITRTCACSRNEIEQNGTHVKWL